MFICMPSAGLKEERVSLLETWRDAERSFGPLGDIRAVEDKLPRKIKMRRMATAEVTNRGGYDDRIRRGSS